MEYKFEKPIHGSLGAKRYQCKIQWRNGVIIADEPILLGGEDAGPDPFTLLLSSIASCILMTLRMYIDRKQWVIPEIEINTNLFQDKKNEKTITTIDCDLVFISEVSQDQRNRLIEIAKHCPISKVLEGEIKVRTFFYNNEETAKQIKYENEEIQIHWKPDLCQHSARCWNNLPQVFDYKKKPWINPQGASSDEIIKQIINCPSGALSYTYLPKNES